ncbi:MAG: nucleoside phosphorylase [Candidatus Hodarchaeales archaeon]|jgi:uridine phosphorylase
MTSLKDFLSDGVIEDEEKRQFHISLAPGEVAPTILLVGDPARALKVSNYFDEVQLSRKNREFVTYTGLYQNMRLSVMGIGIGPSNVEIAIIELSHIVSTPLTIIRIGTCGALSIHVNVGDLVISTGAVRLENTSSFYVDQAYPAIANFEVLNALIHSAEICSSSYHVGLTLTSSGFYGVPDDILDELTKRCVLNHEMESSALFTLSTIVGFRAGTVCAVIGNREKAISITRNKKEQIEKKAILCGLKAAILLGHMDRVKKEKNQQYWHSGLSLKFD